METVIILILWAICSLLVMVQYAPHCKDLNTWDSLVVGLVFIISGPIFVAGNVLEAILDCYLPEGWDQD